MQKQALAHYSSLVWLWALSFFKSSLLIALQRGHLISPLTYSAKRSVCPQREHFIFSMLITSPKHGGEHPLQSRHFFFKSFLINLSGPALIPFIVNTPLLRRKMLDHIFILFRPDRHNPSKYSFRRKSCNQRLKLCPGNRFKFLRFKSQPVLRQEARDDQIPVFENIIVRVTAPPCPSPPPATSCTAD